MKKKIPATLKKIQKAAGGRTTAFVIGNTSDLFPSGRYYETPLRETPEIIYSGVIVRDVATARAVARLVDGAVDYVFVDDEKKIRPIYYGTNDAGNIEKTVRDIITKSVLLSYKGNDLAAEALDALVCNLVPEVSGTRVAIIGMGNFGSKAALKLVERGMHVVAHRRDQKKLRLIGTGLNHLKSEHTISNITLAKNVREACRGAHIIIGVTNEKGVITKDALRYAAPSAILIDAGKGCFAEDVLSDPSVLVYRVDVSIMQKHIFLGLIRTHAHLSKRLGRKYVPELGVTLVSLGLLGASGDVVVDDIDHPTAIIGIVDDGGVLKKRTPQIEKRIKAIRVFCDTLN